MAQWTKLFPSRFGSVDTTIPASASGFSDITAGSAITGWRPWYEIPGGFAREGGGGFVGSLRITANNSATQAHEIMAVLPGPVVNQNAGVMLRSPASWNSSPNGHVRAYLWGDGRFYVDRRSTTSGNAIVGSIDLVTLGRSTRPILCRVRVGGIATATQVQAKAWSFQQPEPDSWDINTTLSIALNNDGHPILYRDGTGFLGFFGMAFSIGTNGDSAPSFVGVISGQVRVNGIPQSGRAVRIVAREDPGYHWDAVSDGSGNYSVRVIRGFTYSVFALDPLVGNFNAPIADKVVPV